jgi:hypothetical protein
MSQEIISGQEGFSRHRFPVLRLWIQAHVEPLSGSPAVKLLIVKHLEKVVKCPEEAVALWLGRAAPKGTQGVDEGEPDFCSPGQPRLRQRAFGNSAQVVGSLAYT